MRQIFPVMNGQKLQKVILPSGHTARSRPVQWESLEVDFKKSSDSGSLVMVCSSE